MYALALAAAGRTAEARAAAVPPQPIARDVLWLFLTGVRGLAAVAVDDWSRAESAYQDLLPYADRPAGADNVVLTLWPAAQILGDIARHFGRPAPRLITSRRSRWPTGPGWRCGGKPHCGVKPRCGVKPHRGG
jgi:hypothetical protein